MGRGKPAISAFQRTGQVVRPTAGCRLKATLLAEHPRLPTTSLQQRRRVSNQASEQPTVCAHFLPDRSTREDTSCGNTSPAAAANKSARRVSHNKDTLWQAGWPTMQARRSGPVSSSQHAPASLPCSAARPSAAASAARASRGGRQVGMDEKGSTEQSLRGGRPVAGGGQADDGSSGTVLERTTCPGAKVCSNCTASSSSSWSLTHCAKGWMGGWGRQAAAAAPLSASLPYLARSEASGA